MVHLLLNPDFSDQSFFDFAARKRGLLDLLDGHQHSGGSVFCQLDLAVRALSKRSLSALHEIQVLFGDGGKHLFKTNLLWRECGLVVALLDEGGGGLNPLNFGQQD